MTVKEHFALWCKETKRSGGVLVGKSIHEFIDYLDNQRNSNVISSHLLHEIIVDLKYGDACDRSSLADKLEEIYFPTENT